MELKKISEEFLHYIWRLKRFDQSNLTTTDGQAIMIMSGGILNHNAGPDFGQGKVRIENTTWAGNIEIHIKSSDWDKHKHQYDKAYDNVILHVVYEHDKDIRNSQGNTIPTLVIGNRIDQALYERYLLFKDNMDWIPCAQHIGSVDKDQVGLSMYQVLIERLENKMNRINDLYLKVDKDWNRLFYILTAKYLVGKVNAEAAEVLMLSIPYPVLLKNHDNLATIEAMLYGQAGMLSDKGDAYTTGLMQEYQFQKHKHSLRSLIMPWKYMRMRPSSFPTIRIAQLAGLMHREANMFSEILDNTNIAGWSKKLKVQASAYWDHHYQFNKETEYKTKSIGQSTVDSLLINVVAPLCFMYGKKVHDDRYIDQALHILSKIKPEKNNIITGWKNLGIDAKDASDTQALIHLKTNYCAHTRCLQCSIGHQIMKG